MDVIAWWFLIVIVLLVFALFFSEWRNYRRDKCEHEWKVYRFCERCGVKMVKKDNIEKIDVRIENGDL